MTKADALNQAKRDGKARANDGTSESTAKWAASVAFPKDTDLRKAFLDAYAAQCAKMDAAPKA
jgi:hypothetical protein